VRISFISARPASLRSANAVPVTVSLKASLAVGTRRDILPDIGDAPARQLDLALRLADLTSDGVLVVDMGGMEPVETSSPAFCIRR
jgi:hypothetical protein